MLLFSSACILGAAFRRRVLVAFPAAALASGLSKFRWWQSVVDLADTGYRIPALDDNHVHHHRAWRRAGMGLVVAGPDAGV